MFDTENELLTANKAGVSASFVYDPMQRQSQKTVGAVKSRYIYSELQRIADYDGVAGTLQNRYVYGTGMDEPLIQVSSAGVLTFLHADKMGSIVATSDSTGVVTNKNAYGPFGEITTLAGTTFGYTGQRYDSELGLSYYKRRMYSSKLGRFLQPDHVGYTGEDFNLYTYVGNSPLKYVDPIGEGSLPGVIAAIIGVIVVSNGIRNTIIKAMPTRFRHEKLWFPLPGEVGPDGFTIEQRNAQKEHKWEDEMERATSCVPITIIKVSGGLGEPLGGSGIVKWYDAETQAAIKAQRPMNTYYTEEGMYLGNDMDFGLA